MRFATRKAFTMMELVVIMVLLTVGFFSIISMLNSGVRFTQIIKTKMVAVNLAREGIESMYQIRDTNRQRRSSNRDRCWLKQNPLVDEVPVPGEEGCELGDKRFGSGNYIIVSSMTGDQTYLEAVSINLPRLDIYDKNVSTGDLQYSLCFSGERYPCPGETYTGGEGKYFRQIIGKGLFLKDSPIAGGEYMECENGSDIVGSSPQLDCGDGSAKEYRFCSRVEYYNGKSVSDVEICSLMTNFLE